MGAETGRMPALVAGYQRRDARRRMEGLLANADIRLQGDRPWDIRLLKPGVPERVLARNSVGLGEAYMDGQWTAERLDQFFERC